MGSFNKNKSKSTVQNAKQRSDIFQGGLADIARGTGQQLNNGALTMPEYQGKDYVNPGQVARLGGGDYDRLENSIRESQWAPIDALKTRRFADIDQSVADRGLYTSGISDDTKQNIFATDFLPAYQQSANQAVATRYGLEQGDNQMANSFNLASSGAENAFNLQDASARNQAAWSPYEYLLNLYNQTGGTNTKSSGFGVTVDAEGIGKGAAAMMASDRRLKTNVTQIAVHPTLNIPIYTWTYLWNEPGVGVMADELREVMPDAVHYDTAGYASVDYAKVWG